MRCQRAYAVTQYRVSLVGTRAATHWWVPGKTCLLVFLPEEGTDPGVSASLWNLFNSLAQDASVWRGLLQRHFGTTHSAWAGLYFLILDLKSSCISMLKIPHHEPNTAGGLFLAVNVIRVASQTEVWRENNPETEDDNCLLHHNASSISLSNLSSIENASVASRVSNC